MSVNILPENADAALKKMVFITQEMIQVTEQQTNSIALRHDLGFYSTTQAKDDLCPLYQQAIQEFKFRKEEFFRLGSSSLKELRELHARLKTETYINMTFLNGMQRQPENK